MRISYCTTCHNRLWQLKQTLPVNIAFAISGEVEICIALYRDDDAEQYLLANYSQHIADGRLKYVHIKQGERWNSPRMKNVAHRFASGKVLFNLDADNYISGVSQYLDALERRQIIITRQNSLKIMDGRIGRIGLLKADFDLLGGYNEKVGSSHDGLLISHAVINRFKLIQVDCLIDPIPNPLKIRQIPER